VVPVLFLLVTALILGTTLVGARADFADAVAQLLHGQFLSGLAVLLHNPPIAGIGLIALGLPVYWLWERRAKDQR
jgi:hypothetical protein